MKNEGRPRISDAALDESPKPAFEPNAFYERIIALRESSPASFDALSPPTKLALGVYEARKREHSRLEDIRREPQAA
jgi:hypothetical protein